jgi:hypothetical protein
MITERQVFLVDVIEWTPEPAHTSRVRAIRVQLHVVLAAVWQANAQEQMAKARHLALDPALPAVQVTHLDPNPTHNPSWFTMPDGKPQPPFGTKMD